jgi:hypothetical protein
MEKSRKKVCLSVNVSDLYLGGFVFESRLRHRLASPNIVVQLVTILLRFREVPCSNIGPDTWVLRIFVFSQSLQVNSALVP